MFLPLLTSVFLLDLAFSVNSSLKGLRVLKDGAECRFGYDLQRVIEKIKKIPQIVPRFIKKKKTSIEVHRNIHISTAR
jgi:hypothetical protein